MVATAFPAPDGELAELPPLGEQLLRNPKERMSSQPVRPPVDVSNDDHPAGPLSTSETSHIPAWVHSRSESGDDQEPGSVPPRVSSRSYAATMGRYRPRSQSAHNALPTPSRSEGSRQQSSSRPTQYHSDQENAATSQSRMRLKHSLQRAVRKANVFRASMHSNRTQRLQSVSGRAHVFPLLGSAMAVPAYFLQRDEKGSKPPPIIWEAMRLSVADSDVDHDQAHFRIELQYGDVKWVVYRRYSEFLRLHYLLTLRYYQGKLPELPKLPSKLNYAFEVAKIYHSEEERERRMRRAAIARRETLQNYLLNLLRVMNMRVSYELCAFLELSSVSITKDLGWKGKEGYLDQKIKRKHQRGCFPKLRRRRWRSKWLLVRDSYVALCNTAGDPYPCDVFMADREFKVEHDFTPVGHNPLHPYRLFISNQTSRIVLRGDNSRQMKEWQKSFQYIQMNSPWAREHRYQSFAPIRDNVHASWFVDGEQYFYAVSEAMAQAKETIFIADWWLSPDLYLRRPPAENEEYRIDRLLYRKAAEGVLIYIVVYKEVTVSLQLSSIWTKYALRSLHPNIMIQRHPDHNPGGTIYWAHHEKIVVVDSNVAFLGGLDLCYGRFDTHAHRLADSTPLVDRDGGVGKQAIRPIMFPGQDFNNARLKDFLNVDKVFYPLIPRESSPRMPWHDVHMAVMGSAARDVARHFIERWNFIKRSKAQQRSTLPYLMPKGEYVSHRDDQALSGSCHTQLLRSSAIWSHGIPKEDSIQRAYRDLILRAEHCVYIENQFFITSALSNPGHEVKNLVGQALVERIVRAYLEGAKFRVIVIMPLMPAFAGDINTNNAATLRLVMSWQYQSICRGAYSVMGQLRQQGVSRPEEYISFFSLRNYDVINRRTARLASPTTSPSVPNQSPSVGPLSTSEGGGEQETMDGGSMISAGNARGNGTDSRYNDSQDVQPGAEPTQTADAAGVVSRVLPKGGSGAAGIPVIHPAAIKSGAEAVADAKLKGKQKSKLTKSSSITSGQNGPKAPEYPPISRLDAQLFEEMRRARREEERRLGLVPPCNSQAPGSSTQPSHRPRKGFRCHSNADQFFQILPRDPPIDPHPPEQRHKYRYHLDNIKHPPLSSTTDLDQQEAMAYVQNFQNSSMLATRAKTACLHDDEEQQYDLASFHHPPHRPHLLTQQYLESNSGSGESTGDDPRTQSRRHRRRDQLHPRHFLRRGSLPNSRSSSLERRGARYDPGYSSDDSIGMVDQDENRQEHYRTHPPHGRRGPGEVSETNSSFKSRLASHAENLLRSARYPHPDKNRPGRRKSLEESGLEANRSVTAPLGQNEDGLTHPAIQFSPNKASTVSPVLGEPRQLQPALLSTGESSRMGVEPRSATPETMPPNQDVTSIPKVEQSSAEPDAEVTLEELCKRYPVCEPNVVEHHVELGEMQQMVEKWLEEHPDADLATLNSLNVPLIKQIVSELVYIHSKIMIVDDRKVIMGSANINDRSMQGDHDSEIAILVEDKSMVDITMDGKPYKAAKFAHTLRTYLCKEHLGLLPDTDMQSIIGEELDIIKYYLDEERKSKVGVVKPKEGDSRCLSGSTSGSDPGRNWLNTIGDVETLGVPNHNSTNGSVNRALSTSSKEKRPLGHNSPKSATQFSDDQATAMVMDPLSESFFMDHWVSTARRNTEAFRKVFHCIPDDTVKNWAQYAQFMPPPHLVGRPVMRGVTHEAILKVLEEVRGHLVVFPLDFLRDENLGAAVMSAELVLPIKVFI
ncbi:hypothetical protein IWQ61_003335 [Dispira simplex]|nr:hypothetical protein IWQ61_003335 [Dispira simplex]